MGYRTFLFTAIYALSSIFCFSQEKQAHTMHGSLKEVVVTSNKVRRVLQSSQEYVVDYLFINDNLLVATQIGKKGKLFVVNVVGDTLAITKLPDQPLALYESCLGVYYCVCMDKFYRIEISGKEISLEDPRKVSLLWYIMPCQCAINDTFYYRYDNSEHFETTYGWRKPNDSMLHPIKTFYLKNQDRWSQQKAAEIEALLAAGNISAAAKVAGVRYLLNNGARHYLSTPLFKMKDSLVIFDLTGKQIELYDGRGKLVRKNDIHFDWGQIEYLHIIQDDSTRKFYLHKNDNPAKQTIEELDVYTGEIASSKVTINKDFPDNVKMHNGNIYFLWQDTHNAATRQLFMQLYP